MAGLSRLGCRRPEDSESKLENPYRAGSKVNPQRMWRREIPTTTFRALLMAGLSPAQYQVVLFIIERTWGFDRESHPISWTEFSNATHLVRRAVSRAIKGLEARQFIVVNHHRREGTRNEYLFNRYWDTWVTDKALDPSIILKGASEGGTSAPNDTSPGTEHPAAEDGASAPNDTGGVSILVPTSAPIDTRGVPSSKLAASLRQKYRQKETETLIERDQIFTLWNSLKIIEHRGLTDKRSRAILTALKDHTVEEICQAVINYAKIQHGEEYFWDYRWTLELFLSRGLERFIGDEETILHNYLKDKGGRDARTAQRTPDTPGRGDKEPTDEQYLRSLPRDQRGR